MKRVGGTVTTRVARASVFMAQAGAALWIVLFIWCTQAGAAPGRDPEAETLAEPSLEPRPTQDLILGVIADQTITRIGREFYQGFLSTWRDFGGDAEQYNLAIYERPSARWGSLVWVEKDRVRLFHMFIHPGRGDYARIGEQAARQVYGRASQFEIEKQLFKEPDLGDEEI